MNYYMLDRTQKLECVGPMCVAYTLDRKGNVVGLFGNRGGWDTEKVTNITNLWVTELDSSGSTMTPEVFSFYSWKSGPGEGILRPLHSTLRYVPYVSCQLREDSLLVMWGVSHGSGGSHTDQHTAYFISIIDKLFNVSACPRCPDSLLSHESAWFLPVDPTLLLPTFFGGAWFCWCLNHDLSFLDHEHMRSSLTLPSTFSLLPGEC